MPQFPYPSNWSNVNLTPAFECSSSSKPIFPMFVETHQPQFQQLSSKLLITQVLSFSVDVEARQWHLRLLMSGSEALRLSDWDRMGSLKQTKGIQIVAKQNVGRQRLLKIGYQSNEKWIIMRKNIPLKYEFNVRKDSSLKAFDQQLIIMVERCPISGYEPRVTWRVLFLSQHRKLQSLFTRGHHIIVIDLYTLHWNFHSSNSNSGKGTSHLPSDYSSNRFWSKMLGYIRYGSSMMNRSLVELYVPFHKFDKREFQRNRCM